MGLFILAQTLTAQIWTQTGAASNNWNCIASSANGSRLIAGAWPGLVYLSTNSGATWAPAITTTDSWSSVSSSADGTKLMATSWANGIFISTNSGATWISTNWPDSYWGSGASSADGKTLAATALNSGNLFSPGGVYCSTNSGATWTSINLRAPVGVTMSADGSKMVVVASTNLWRSTNSGMTWTPVAGAPSVYGWASPSQYIASSADGKKLIYCVPSNTYSQPGIYVSTDSGNSWNLTSAPYDEWWLAVASSADGNTLLAVPNAGPSTPFPIYLSTDSGATWTTRNSPNQIWGGGVASSVDGGKLFAAAGFFGNGPIYISRSVRAPRINVVRTHGNVKLFWFVPSTNFALQQSADLTKWTDITNTPVPSADNLDNQVTLTGTNKIGFYRLKTP